MFVNARPIGGYLGGPRFHSPYQEHTLEWTEPLPDGLFLLGEDSDRNRFLFNFSPTSEWVLSMPSPQLYEQINQILPFPNLIPVIARSSESTIREADIDTARQVRELVTQWAEAWKNKDLDSFIGLYADRITTFFPGVEKSVIYPRDQVRLLQKMNSSTSAISRL